MIILKAERFVSLLWQDPSQGTLSNCNIACQLPFIASFIQWDNIKIHQIYILGVILASLAHSLHATCIASPQTAWLFYHSVISTRSPLINQLSRDWIIKQLLSSVTSPSFDEIMNPPCTNSSYHTNQCLITDFVFGLQILVCIKASARDEGANYSTFIYHYKNNWLLVSPSCIIWFSTHFKCVWHTIYLFNPNQWVTETRKKS